MKLHDYFKSKHISFQEEADPLLSILNDDFEDFFPFCDNVSRQLYLGKQTKDSLSDEIVDLLTWAENEPIPVEMVSLDQCTTINDCSLFVNYSISTIRANGHKKIYQPYIDSLIRYKQLITLKNGTK